MSYNPRVKGDQLNATANNTGSDLQNNSGLTVVKTTPIRVDGNGEIRPINVSVEAEALSTVGVALENILNGSVGYIATSGRIENIVTTANNGDVLYVSKTGGLTNVKPSLDVGGFVPGDFIVKIGTLFKNVSNPSQQDLLINISVIGQL